MKTKNTSKPFTKVPRPESKSTTYGRMAFTAEASAPPRGKTPRRDGNRKTHSSGRPTSSSTAGKTPFVPADQANKLSFKVRRNPSQSTRDACQSKSIDVKKKAEAPLSHLNCNGNAEVKTGNGRVQSGVGSGQLPSHNRRDGQE